MKKIYIETYGCTLNAADSDIMQALLKEKDYSIVDNENDSDVIVINTCTVKGATENKIMARIKSLEKKGKKIVVAGCMSANEKKIKKAAPLSPILGTGALKFIDSAVEAAYLGEDKVFKSNETKDLLPKILMAPIMRIPINDGCTSACYFCQTKIARPYLRSYSPKTVVKWIVESVKNNAREVQLTSMDSGAYGIDIKTNLISLLKAISDNNSDDVQQIKDIEYYIRLGMINPDHALRMLEDLIKIMEQNPFYKFLHVPVQSGSEKVCREMNRDHSVEEFEKIVTKIREKIPDATISTDIIVGYPTESEDDYLETVRLMQRTRPDIVNISKFSARPGTKAKELKPLDSKIVKERSRKLNLLVKKIERENKKKYIGKIYRVLITEKETGTHKDFKGRNINYCQVVVKDFNGKLGDFVNVKIVDANHGSLFGKII